MPLAPKILLLLFLKVNVPMVVCRRPSLLTSWGARPVIHYRGESGGGTSVGPDNLQCMHKACVNLPAVMHTLAQHAEWLLAFADSHDQHTRGA
jgi:hypothetical protein